MLDYQMQIAGRALRAQQIDSEVRHFEDWLKEERKSDSKYKVDRMVPVQEKLIDLLLYATTRRHTGVSPAEFRDVVEGRRRQVVA
ncbi:MAG: hypothetical protein KAJ19_23985 [Gammaproteobacteria bacterium]|nr:hypothetical protein [Gammaproteobacteria bacterium]